MKRSNFLYRFLRPILVLIMKAVFHPRIVGRHNIPSLEGAIIAGNHKNLLDPILVDISTKRTVYALGKKSLFKGPLGIFLKTIGTIPVDQYSESNKGALNEAFKLLEGDNLVNISPEGRVNKSDKLLLPFKYGAVSLAMKTRKKIIPYAITGKYIPFINNLKITFGKPIDIMEDDYDKANERLYNEVKLLLLKNISNWKLNRVEVTNYEGRHGAVKHI